MRFAFMWCRGGVVLEHAYCVAGDRKINILNTTRTIHVVYKSPTHVR